MKTKNLYIIRHGETDWNKNQKLQGQSDIQLNDVGREQAKALIPSLQKLNIQSIYSSPLSRALETAKIVNSEFKLNIIKDDRLKETNVGEAEGLTLEEINTKFGIDFLQRWRSYDERLLDLSYPNGESKRKMMVRARTAMIEIAQQSEFESIALFSHGMLMRALTYIFGAGVAWEPQAFVNGSIHHFLWNENFQDTLKYLGKI